MKPAKHLLRELIAQNTYSGDYRGILDVITAFLREHTDFEVRLQQIDATKANLIATVGRPSLVMNCHMDTVPPAGDWQADPLMLRETSDRYIGLGTCDTKGNLYAVLQAASVAKPQNLMLLFSVDEERGVKTGVHYFLESDAPVGITRAMVFEPTELRWVNRHQGYHSFYIGHGGPAGHSSIAAEGAIVKAARTILKLHEAGFNIGRIEGGKAGNVISDSCDIKASVRNYLAPEETLEKVQSLVEDGRVKPSFVGPPLMNDTPRFDGVFHAVDFWTEAALFQAAGINAVVFGAGNIAQAHRAEEFVEKHALQKAIEILSVVMGGA